jgi:hypothetical protein
MHVGTNTRRSSATTASSLLGKDRAPHKATVRRDYRHRPGLPGDPDQSRSLLVVCPVKVFAALGHAGEEPAVLAIVTTLELDPNSKKYKKPVVEKLSRAALKYLADSGKATAFVLMNRPKDWPQGG